jgi:uncharacterized protein
MARIVISGASGMIGSALIPFLEAHGCEVKKLVRRRARDASELPWNPIVPLSPAQVSGCDVVIHLSGESVVGRWTEAKKRRIRESRVVSTRNLAQALARTTQPPGVFLCASAIGYYGDRGDEVLSEESPRGSGFFAEVCREWEGAAAPAFEAGIRVVNLRIGIVLSRSGGALKPMLLPFRLGLGGRMGNGRQWWSWIHIDDVVAAVWHAVETPTLFGPVNTTAPNPATNAELTRVLARVVHRPAVLPVPAFAVRLAFGEFANEGLLASSRVEPKKLAASKFVFKFPALTNALNNVLDKQDADVLPNPRKRGAM